MAKCKTAKADMTMRPHVTYEEQKALYQKLPEMYTKLLSIIHSYTIIHITKNLTKCVKIQNISMKTSQI